MTESRHDHSEAGQRRGAKTEAIRTVMAEHPDWGGKQIHEELTRRGIRVSIQMVYKVLEAVKTAAIKPVNIEDLSLQEVMEFKQLVVDAYGGLQRVEAMVNALKKLQCPEDTEGEDEGESGPPTPPPKYRGIDDD
jgi:hypothetical protein